MRCLAPTRGPGRVRPCADVMIEVVVDSEDCVLRRPDVRRALIDLADMTEYDGLGGSPPQELLDLVDSGVAFGSSGERVIRALVPRRVAQLQTWLVRARPGAPQLADACRCLRVLRQAGLV